MSDAGFIILAWGVTIVVLGGYVVSVMLRARSMSAQVPAERQHWLTTPETPADQAVRDEDRP